MGEGWEEFEGRGEERLGGGEVEEGSLAGEWERGEVRGNALQFPSISLLFQEVATQDICGGGARYV